EPSLSSGLVMTASTSTSSVPSTVTNTNYNTSNITSTTTNTDQVVLPLSPGCLTNNLGIPITIVCCKSDAINTLEQTHDFKDDQFDYIQQTLRCICMKYGASLFYTSTLHPYTYHHLREYILHRVLSTPAKSYLFQIKAQTIERDTVLVPSGWDSWGKIKVLREGFDCEHVNEGWDADMDAVTDRQRPGKNGARGTFEEAIPDIELDIQPQHIPVSTICEDEQVFYERHFETLQRTNEANGRQGTGSNVRPGVVGPLSVSTAAIDMMRSVNTNGTQSPNSAMVASPVSSSSAAAAAAVAAAASSNSPLNNAAATQNGPSHEVLANFFQSLLSKKASTGGGSPTTATSPASSLLNGGGQSNGKVEEHAATYRRPTISRKDVHKELDRMKQYTASK
ncbi:DLIC-domain-containing protein, partial [Backusella circina FSU 941]